jgi:DNA-directed RNA polymerase subunit H (RpoH/RPB5)
LNKTKGCLIANFATVPDKVLYLIEDSKDSRRAIGKYIDVWHYPDGHKELRLNDVQPPYSTYDRLSEVDPVAIVDNKRLGHVLEVSRQSRENGTIIAHNRYLLVMSLPEDVMLRASTNPSAR